MSTAVTSYGQTIERLSATTDPQERARLATLLTSQLEHAFAQQTNVTQVVRWETEEWLRQRVGETNDLISALVAESRSARAGAADDVKAGFDGLQQAIAAFRTQQEAATLELRREFQREFGQVGERLNEMSDDVAALKEFGGRQEKFNNTLVLRMDALGTRMQHLEAGQSALVGRVDEQDRRHKAQIAELTRELEESRQQIADVRALLAGRPSNDEAQRLVTMIHDHDERLRAMEAQQEPRGPQRPDAD